MATNRINENCKEFTIQTADSARLSKIIEEQKQKNFTTKFVSWNKHEAVFIPAVVTLNLFGTIKVNVGTTAVTESKIKVGPGAYKLPNGDIYIVKPSKQLNADNSVRLYAMKMVESPSKRLAADGQHVDFEFAYARGAIYNLLPEHKMTLAEAKALMIIYGRCIICGRKLKVAESIERGMGPVCAGYFSN